MKTIDINCDVGEGIENEHLLMPYISSCNIACGGHFGDQFTIDKTIQLAIDNNVKIGVHPSFPDKENFGRKIMDISDVELQESLILQMQLFKKRAALKNAIIHHVKPHGELYNLIAVDQEKAILFVNAIQQVFENVKVYVPFNSVMENVALENRIEIVYEAFADRNYNDNLTLVSRSLPYAVITDKAQVLRHVKMMNDESKVRTVTCSEIEIKADTFCVHGDNKNAIEILQYLQENL
jgi:UPF0271 protein